MLLLLPLCWEPESRAADVVGLRPCRYGLTKGLLLQMCEVLGNEKLFLM